MKSDLSVFDNHLMNGLLFCKRVYDLFAKIRNSHNGIRRLRLRKGKVEKKLIEELIPIARYIQARYNQSRQLRVRWIDGRQRYDARLLSVGPLADKRLLQKKQFAEVTTAVHENDHILRRLIDEQGGAFSVKGIKLKQKPKGVESSPYVYRNDEAQTDLTNRILKRIQSKNKKEYPPKTVLLVQCFLDTTFLQNEWDDTIDNLIKKRIDHKFYEVLVFDSNSHYTATIPGKPN